MTDTCKLEVSMSKPIKLNSTQGDLILTIRAGLFPCYLNKTIFSKPMCYNFFSNQNYFWFSTHPRTIVGIAHVTSGQ